MTPTPILLASNNRGKLVELQALLPAAAGYRLLLPADISLALDVVEDGLTYADNAALKATAFHRATATGAYIILADDSGLEVDALGGAPGLHSARYAEHIKKGATDADRRAFLLHNLQDKPRPWTAHFHCTVALVSPVGELVFAVGDCPGEIIPTERGSNGFGYDPIFWLPAAQRTMAELSMDQKNQLSHRALAVQAAIPTLRRWL
jgi:XTP/dITP diphosphohydrolase